MRPVYKVLNLTKDALSAVLSLKASVTSDGEESEQNVDANILQNLKVALSVPNVTGERDLIASGECVLDGNELKIDLSNFDEGTYRLFVKAVFGTQTKVLYGLDVVVPESGLAEGTQEYEDTVTIVSTIADIIGSDLEGFALEATSQEIKSAITPISQAAEAYNVGKTQLAQAITSKGVEASPTESYPEMAEKVNAISQETYEINGGEMYAKQLFGVANNNIVPGYWNLYDVLAQLLSDGRLVNYGGILLAEYYKGYDSLALSGAGAGGAYVVSDKDSDGNFIMYTEDTTHVWATEFDGKGNRWVAYCFADAGHDFEITDTNTSPRSIFIGREVGKIRSLVSGRCSEIVVPDGNKLGGMDGSFTQTWNKKIVIRNIETITNTSPYDPTGAESLYISGKSAPNGALLLQSLSYNTVWSLRSAIFKIENPVNICFLSLNRTDLNMQSFQNLAFVSIKMEGHVYLGGLDVNDAIRSTIAGDYLNNLKDFEIISEQMTIHDCYRSPSFNNTRFILTYTTNDKDKSIVFTKPYDTARLGFSSIKDVELKDGWCKPVNIALCTALTEANMYAHILQRLKQDEPDCGDGVTITLGSKNLAKLTSAESVQLLDDLTNIYGYTFA